MQKPVFMEADGFSGRKPPHELGFDYAELGGCMPLFGDPNIPSDDDPMTVAGEVEVIVASEGADVNAEFAIRRP